MFEFFGLGKGISREKLLKLVKSTFFRLRSSFHKLLYLSLLQIISTISILWLLSHAELVPQKADQPWSETIIMKALLARLAPDGSSPSCSPPEAALLWCWHKHRFDYVMAWIRWIRMTRSIVKVAFFDRSVLARSFSCSVSLSGTSARWGQCKQTTSVCKPMKVCVSYNSMEGNAG